MQLRLVLDVDYKLNGVSAAVLIANMDEDDSDTVFGYADGLSQKYLMARITGRCSIQAMIDFDVAQYEAKVDNDILTLTRLLSMTEATQDATVRIRHDIFSVKADQRDGAGFCHVFMTYDSEKAFLKAAEIRNDDSLGLNRLANVIHPAQWVVDGYLMHGNSIVK